MGSENKRHKVVLSQSLFTTVHLPETSWRSYLTSGAMHGVLILALLLITVPMIRQHVEREESVTLVAPQIPTYHPRTMIPPAHALALTKTQIPRPRVQPKPVPVEKLIPPKPVPVPEKLVAAAPRIEVVVPAPAPPPAVNPMPSPAPPKPEVRTGTFQAVQSARAQQKPRELQVGGFGDPNGTPPTDQTRQSRMTMATVGSFDLPQGSGKAGGGGQRSAGGIRQTAFGDGGAASNSNSHSPLGQVHQAGFGDGVSAAGSGARNSAGSVKTGAFGETPVGRQKTAFASRSKPVPPALTPVEIISKPKPLYTQEARNLKLEGQVSLDVMFQSNGSIRILRVVRGLGHGLDEAAEQAALHVRFRPATKDGVPVDSSAIIHITFELS